MPSVTDPAVLFYVVLSGGLSALIVGAACLLRRYYGYAAAAFAVAVFAALAASGLAHAPDEGRHGVGIAVAALIWVPFTYFALRSLAAARGGYDANPLGSIGR